MFSVYDNVYAVSPSHTASLATIKSYIDGYDVVINKPRRRVVSLLALSAITSSSALREKSPVYMPSGNACGTRHPSQYSNVLGIDYDGVGDANIPELMSQLTCMPNYLLGYESQSGQGIHALFDAGRAVNSDMPAVQCEQSYRDAVRLLIARLPMNELIDTNSDQPSRLFTLSYSPPYLPKPAPDKASVDRLKIGELLIARRKEQDRRRQKYRDYIASDDDTRTAYVHAQSDIIAAAMPPCGQYQDWIRYLFAVALCKAFDAQTVLGWCQNPNSSIDKSAIRSTWRKAERYDRKWGGVMRLISISGGTRYSDWCRQHRSI